GMNPESSEQRQHARMIVNVLEVVEHDEQPFAAVAPAQSGERVTDLAHTFALAEEAVQAVGVDVIEAEELLGAAEAVVGGAHPPWACALRPDHSAHRAQLERTPFIKAHYRAARRARPIEAPDAFFFVSKA